MRTSKVTDITYRQLSNGFFIHVFKIGHKYTACLTDTSNNDNPTIERHTGLNKKQATELTNHWVETDLLEQSEY